MALTRRNLFYIRQFNPHSLTKNNTPYSAPSLVLSPGRINIVMASDHAALNSLDDSLTELGDGAAGSAGVMGSILRAALEKQAGKLAGNSKLKEAIQNNDKEALTAIIAKQQD